MENVARVDTINLSGGKMLVIFKLVALVKALYGLSGCAKYSDTPVVVGADAEEAAIRLESSRRETTTA